jgi:hypothetical protein
VILTERSEVHSGSRRQPAVSTARPTLTLGISPLSLQQFGVRLMSRGEINMGKRWRPEDARIDLPLLTITFVEGERRFRPHHRLDPGQIVIADSFDEPLDDFNDYVV